MKLLQLFAIVALGLTMAGCGPLERSVSIPYQSYGYANQRPANNIPVVIKVEDDRTLYESDRIGEYDNPMQYGRDEVYVSSNDIPKTLQDAFAREFGIAGFSVGAAGKQVEVKLVKFWAERETRGFFGVVVKGHGKIVVEVRDQYGRLMTTKTFETKTERDDVRSYTDYGRVLQTVMGQLVRDVIHDQAIMQALYYRTY